eukprot:c19626_g2_i2.p1 GENE.c19626_g2_i2~~c19626_g2_i2.p1  ORF type:complete len:168 (+),score=46.36 c19626_g2_i2:148-651(+)
MLFQIVRYHGKDSSDFVRSKQFENFPMIMHPNAGLYVIANGLHYLAKLLSLQEHEQERQDAGREVLPEAQRRRLDKTSRRVADQAAKQFIKFHMIYKNVNKSMDDKPKRVSTFQPAASFQSLARLYYVIKTSPACERLRQNNRDGSDDILRSLEAVYKMFNARNQAF